jgi:hypothetical protein
VDRSLKEYTMTGGIASTGLFERLVAAPQNLIIMMALAAVSGQLVAPDDGHLVTVFS